MTTDRPNNENNALIEKHSFSETILSKRFLLRLKQGLTNVLQLPVPVPNKVKAQEPVDTTVTDSENKENYENSTTGPISATSSINSEDNILHLSKTYVLNGVDIGQFISENEIQEYLKNETGRDRLHEMFSKNYLNQYSYQVKFIGTVVGEVAVVVGFLTSLMFQHHIVDDFKRSNRSTLFRSRFLAKRRYFDHMFLNTVHHSLRWSFKISSFTAVYLLLAQSISTYKNKTSPLDFGIAGAIAGGFFRFNMGPKGIFAGAVISAPVGLLFGTLLTGIFYMFNSTQEQMHYSAIQAKLYEKKENQGILPPLPPKSSTKISTGYGG